MCSHYISERRRAYYLKHYGIVLPPNWEAPRGTSHVYPTQLAPIVRRPPERSSGDEAVPPFEAVMAHFGLLPGFARDLKYGVRTYNARTETVATLPSFKSAWAKARHCIVPCEAIYEPDWRSGKHVPTRFAAANDETFGVAGLWQPWRAPTGEWLTSFAMLTVNADEHPQFKHMHRYDPKLAPDAQDKRMVVILPEAQYAQWLDATPEQSMDFMNLYPADRIDMTPEPLPEKAPPAKKVPDTGSLF
ncbi:SOS response-associated peptidase family protein [Variovorax sp. J22R133]|uniref:SOS response-associated peptidase n=1 Tax=Variovorax brevis TaxID=3053503 RepID=UPI002574D758|nr:SOS response-associated peptidase family protein [Variovorax sp. J22R133]MDM0115887.1 SOS response-associated peptidase family protein [Variovorax sp. J22R133]